MVNVLDATELEHFINYDDAFSNSWSEVCVLLVLGWAPLRVSDMGYLALAWLTGCP